jgi:N-acetyl sugar amidotransferase
LIERIITGGIMNSIKYCRKCLTPSSRPRIVFDDQGVCNACRHSENKDVGIDWNERKKEFLELIEPYRSKNGEWDCVVPWSGGKDSSYVAYRLKYEFGMNPLLVTVSPQIPTEVGVYNREMMIQAGFNQLFFRPDQKIHRHLARRFFIERGDQKIPWTANVNAIPILVATKFKIPLVFYAEHGESEYGGKVLSEQSKKMRDFTEVLEHQIGDDPRNWVDDVVTEKDLSPYQYPDIEEVRAVGVKAMYFGYFFRWSMFENFEYIKSKVDFRTHPAGRTPGTFTSWDSIDDKSDCLYYYMQFVKFGFGRAIRDASRMIQNNHMTREEGFKLAKLYDGESNIEFLKDMQEYLNLSDKEFWNIVDKHRNQEIWKKENGQWILKHPLVE